MWKVVNEQQSEKSSNKLGNPFYGYRQTTIETANGQQAEFHGVLVGDCVHVVALEDDLTLYLVRQPRPNFRQRDLRDIPSVLELPGGFVDQGDSLEIAAQKELGSEIKKSAKSLAPIGVLAAYPGISDEQDHIFIGQGLTSLVDNDFAEEVTEGGLTVVTENFVDIFDRMRAGKELVSAQTVAALALASRYI